MDCANLMAEQVWSKGERWKLRRQASACLHVTRSSEHESGEFRQALTGLQECDGFVVLAVLAHVLILCAYHRVVQHGAAVLSSGTEARGHGECGLRASE
jgi:hypothetical protein